MSTYQGLVNQGATCYLNSLIQTLFMTYQFRTNVYTYIHDPKKIAEKNSIPYQLQKLFVNLQTKDKPCYTSDLLKSFQWNDGQAFQQHDVQEFCRLLFQAIELAHKDTAWIKQLFEGTTQSYVNCGKHNSVRQQFFMDIALPIRDQYTLKTYSSIEESLRDYLKPEKLEDKFLCEGCGQKVFVQKGMTLGSVPPILTLQLNRFELNYETFQRQKINSFFYFPQILEMYRFMKPYKEIQIKGLPKNIQIKTVTVAKEANPRTINFSNLVAEKPRQRKKSDDKIGKKQTVTYFDEQNKDKRAKEEKDLSKEDQKLKHLEILASLKSEKGKFDKKLEKIKEKQQVDLDNDMLFGMTGLVDDKNWAAAANVGSIEHPTFDKKQTKFEHQQEAFDPEKQYPDLTYALYAVLVHSGGSYGGHYFAYISDGYGWYKFDDALVTKVKRSEIRQYGVNSNSSYGTNAYLLFYRDVKTFREVKNIQIPKELLQKVKIQQQKLEQLRKQSKNNKQEFVKNFTSNRTDRLEQLSKAMIVRVFKDNTSEALTLTICDKTEETINSLRQKIKYHFKITEKDQNWRLRRYNKSFDAMYEAYDAGDLTLENLDFGADLSLTIQYKKDEEVFEPFDPKKITIKVSVWQPNVSMIVERKKNIIKIPILEEDKFEKLYNLIARATGISTPLMIKRNFSRKNPLQKLRLEDNKDKQIIDLRFFNNILIYVEEDDNSEKTKWQLQFQNERHRCLFKFNNPLIGEDKNEELYFDTRKTLGDLKAEFSKIIGLTEDNFRIKKGKNSLAEMTTYKKKLSDLRFINTQYLYLEEGVSSKGSVIVHRGEVQLVNDKIDFKVHEELVFELSNELLNVGDLIRKISQKTGIPSDNIRVRQYRNFEFKQIFTYATEIQGIRQKSLVWQLVQGQIPKGLQIYYRVFDIVNFQFGELKSIYADSSSSYEELAFMIEEQTGIQNNKVLVWKPLSNYVEKQYMLDVQWSQIRYIHATLKQEPLLIRTDGDIIIIKQAEKAYEAPKGKKAPKIQNYAAKGQAKLKITVIAQNQNPSEAVPQSEPKIESKKIEEPQQTSNVKE